MIRSTVGWLLVERQRTLKPGLDSRFLQRGTQSITFGNLDRITLLSCASARTVSARGKDSPNVTCAQDGESSKHMLPYSTTCVSCGRQDVGTGERTIR